MQNRNYGAALIVGAVILGYAALGVGAVVLIVNALR